MKVLPIDEEEEIKKRNRLQKQLPKKHKIAHEAGRSTKELWRQIVSKSKKKK